MAEEKNYRSFEGKIRNLQKKNEFIYEVELWLLNDIRNRNGWLFTDMRGNKDQFASTPILIAYINNGKTIGSGHEFEMEYDEEGNESPTFTAATSERIIGMISEDTSDIRVETLEDGTNWIVAKGFIWKWYAKEAAEKIEADTNAGKPMSLSIEALVQEFHMDGDTEIEDKYLILGTTLLGDGVMPAVADAHIRSLEAIESEFKTLKIRAASYIKGNEVHEEIKVEEPEATETINKPHDSKNNAKESVKMTKFNKKQVAELASKFEGYTVLAAGSDENGIHICLMSDDGATATYTMDSLEDTVAPEKIVKVNAQIAFTGSDWEIAVDAYELVEDFMVKNVKVNADLDKAQEELKDANDKIEQMVKNEMNRRVSAAKETAADTLAKFNANRVSPVADSVLDSIMASIDNGEFSAYENENGEWIGAEEVKTKVLASCAADVMEKDAAEANAHKKQFVWEGIKGNSSFDRGDVASLLDQLDI